MDDVYLKVLKGLQTVLLFHCNLCLGRCIYVHTFIYGLSSKNSKLYSCSEVSSEHHDLSIWLQDCHLIFFVWVPQRNLAFCATKGQHGPSIKFWSVCILWVSWIITQLHKSGCWKLSLVHLSVSPSLCLIDHQVLLSFWIYIKYVCFSLSPLSIPPLSNLRHLWPELLQHLLAAFIQSLLYVHCLLTTYQLFLCIRINWLFKKL